MGNTVKVSVFEQEQDDPAADTHVCLVAQSCPTLCDPMDCSPPHSSVHGILQAGILEWVVMPSPQGIFPTQGSNPGLPHCRQILYHLSHQENPRILEWIAYPLSRGTSRPRNLNRGLLHCKRILYQLSHQGSIAAAVTSPLMWGELATPWDKLRWTDPKFKVVRGRQWPLTICIQKPCLWNLVDLPPLWLQFKLYHSYPTSCEFPCHCFIPEYLDCCQ